MVRKLQQISIVALFVLSFISFASNVAVGQQIPDYIFLEVLDSEKKPIEGAKVKAIANNFAPSQKEGLTNHKGNYRFFLGYQSARTAQTSLFTVLREGFFTYNDLGGEYQRFQNNVQIEMLKVPQNDVERKVLGDEQIKREFMWAAKTGDTLTVKKLLKEGINPNLNTKDLRGVGGYTNKPAIFFAAASGNGKTVKAFIDAGVKVKGGNETIRRILLTYLKANPFYWNKPKTESQRKEILDRYEKGVQTLVNAGAKTKVSAMGNEIRQPIMVAAEKGYTKTVKFLLDKGFSANSTDTQGKPLLAYAADNDDYRENNVSKIETVSFLLEQKADPNQGCGSALRIASKRGDIAVIKILVKNGAKFNLECFKSETPFILAVGRKKVAAAKYLIEAGADVSAKNRRDENALMIAADNNNVEMIKMLLEKGFQIDEKQKYGWTTLLAALNSFPQFKTIEALLKAGANPNFISQYEDSSKCHTPLKFVTKNPNVELLKLLVSYGADVNMACGNEELLLVTAIRKPNYEYVKQLIEFGVDVKDSEVDEALEYINKRYPKTSYFRESVDKITRLIKEQRAKEKS